MFTVMDYVTQAGFKSLPADSCCTLTSRVRGLEKQ